MHCGGGGGILTAPDPSGLRSIMPVEPTDGSAGASSERRQAERLSSDRQRVDRLAWQSATALLVALVALALAGLFAWRHLLLTRELDAALAREQRSGQLAARDFDELRASLSALERRSAANSGALEPLAPLPGRVAELERGYGEVQARIEQPQRAVARTEAALLVELGERRLQMDRDVEGAAALYAAADQRLAQYHDPGTQSIRAQLARDLDTLHAVVSPDLSAIAARLARAEQSIQQLPVLGMIQTHYTPPGATITERPGLARAWQQLTTSLNNLVRIRRASDAAVELVSLEESDVRRHRLEALLFAARLAALRGDEAEYELGLRTARDWLTRFFDGQDARVVALAGELKELEESRIAPPLPDVSGSLRMLRGRGP
jgi:uroporphyrin-III C-methyltransferase